MAIVTLGIDLAKNVFALHGVDASGKPVLVRPSVHAASCWSWSPRCRPA
jgi:transposase